MAVTKCDSYKIFEKNIERSRAFIRIFQKGRGAGQPTNDEKELLRGAVVFAVGALDGFLHELVLEVVPKFGGDKAAMTEPLRAIAKEDPSLSLRVALAPDGADRKEEFRKALGEWLDRKSFQGVQQVHSALSYVGITKSLTDFDATTGKNTAERLAHFTGLRHKIVHRGFKPDIKRDVAIECIDLIAAIANEVNSDIVAMYYR